MTAPSNLSFETAGATPGSALAWTQTIVSTAGEIGDYSTGTRAETFEGWVTGYVFGELPSGSKANGGVEDFSWYPVAASGMGTYRLEFSGSDLASGIAETFSSAWFSGQSDYRMSGFEVGDTSAGGTEGFEAWTPAMAGYRTSGFEVGDLTDSHVEDFEDVLPPAVFSVGSTPTTTLLSPGHSLFNGAQVFLTTTADDLPAGLYRLTRYYVVNATPGVSFGLSLTLAGSAVTVTDAGSGEHTATGDPALYWTEVLG